MTKKPFVTKEKLEEIAAINPNEEDVEKKMRLFDKPLFKNTDDSFTFTPLNNNTTTFMFTN